MSNIEYHVVNQESGESVAVYKDKFDAQMKAAELNSQEPGYKYKAEVR